MSTIDIKPFASIVGDTSVSTARADRIAYAHDLWPRMTLAVRDSGVSEFVLPGAIVTPRSREDVAKVLTAAGRSGYAVIPYGGGSGVCGATVPGTDRPAIMLDLKALDAIHSVDTTTMLAHVETGIIGEVLERRLNERGVTLGHFPSSIYCSSLGGWIATRSGGQLSARYGKIEDLIERMTVVFPDGSIETVGDGAGGIDDMALQSLVGAEGMFGVVTDAVLRVRPLPEARCFRGFYFTSLDDALNGVQKMMQADVRPAALRLYDPVDTLFSSSGSGSGEHTERPHRIPTAPPAHRSTARRMHDGLQHLVPHYQRYFASAGFAAPGVINAVLRKRAGKVKLITSFEGPEAIASAQCDEAVRICTDAGGRDRGAELGEHWWARRYAVSYGLSPVFDSGLFADTIEVATTWSNLRVLYQAIRRAIQPHGLVMAHFSHAYETGCSIYFTVASGAPTQDGRRERYARLWDAALSACEQAGGAIAHHHGVGLLKKKSLRREYGAGARVLEAVRMASDAGNTLNPGKLVFESDGSCVIDPAVPEPNNSAHTTDVIIDAYAHVATVPVAKPIGDVEKTLNAMRFTLGPLLPGVREWTVGEWLTHPAGRAFTTHHHRGGWGRDRVLGCRGRLANGAPVRATTAPRHATGPDLVSLSLLAHTMNAATVDVVDLRIYPVGGNALAHGWEFPDVASALTAVHALSHSDALPARALLLKNTSDTGCVLHCDWTGPDGIVAAAVEYTRGALFDNAGATDASADFWKRWDAGDVPAPFDTPGQIRAVRAYWDAWRGKLSDALSAPELHIAWTHFSPHDATAYITGEKGAMRDVCAEAGNAGAAMYALDSPDGAAIQPFTQKLLSGLASVA